MARGANTGTKRAAKKGGGGGGLEPNLYHLSGSSTHITYSTSSIVGEPQFAYNDRLFIGKQIHTAPTEIGTLVTVELNHIPDLKRTTFTLLVPDVVLGEQSGGAHIETIGITTVHRDSIIGPPQGQTELYTVERLRGTAQFVFT